jgi:hypothetical protein
MTWIESRVSLNRSRRFEMIRSFDGLTRIIRLLNFYDSLYDTIVSSSYIKLDSSTF